MNTFHIIYLVVVALVLLISYRFSLTSPKARKLSITLFLVFQIIYLLWRTIYTLPSVGWLSLLVGLLLLLSEWGGFFQTIVSSLLFWKKHKRKEVPISALKSLPKVDIFIATYNESVDLLRRTIVATQLIDYPKDKVSILVCDDGRREDVRLLCEELNVRHITRPDNKHAKAGNLNHAMTVSSGEIIVTMDADMVPRSNFLNETLGYFSNERTGFVQAPQAFYNEDSFQYNLFAGDRINNEQDFFMRLIEEAKDRFNVTMYIGSNAVFRRSVLEEIGGFATGVITEDMATGMLIQANGWESVFVNKVLAVGLAPETYKDLLKQRDRWGRGNVQVMRKYNPLKLNGLTALQKLLYLDGVHYWFSGIYKLVFLLAPILYLVFGIFVLEAAFLELLVFWLPAFLSSQVFANLIYEKKRTVLWGHIYDIALAPSMAWAMISEVFFKKEFSFNVTRKGVYTNTRYFLWKSSWFHILLTLLSLIGITRGILAFVRPDLVSLEINSLYINLFWMLFNLLGLLVVMLIFFERPRYRSAERFKHPIETTIISESVIPATIIDLSETGGRISVAQEHLPKKDKQTLLLNLVDKDPIECEIRWVNPATNGKVDVGIRFIDLPPDSYRQIVKIIYADPTSSIGEKSNYKPGLFPIIGNFLRYSKKVPFTQRRLLLRNKIKVEGIVTINDLNYSASLVDISEGGTQIKTKVKLEKGDSVKLQAPSENIENKKGEIKWVNTRFGSVYAGIEFVD